MGLRKKLADRPSTDLEVIDQRSLSLAEWAKFSYGGHPYAVQQTYSAWSGGESVPGTFAGHVAGAYQSSGPVFACVLARQLVFSEARFAWRGYERGRPTDLFGNRDLAILETPWPNGTTGSLLARMEQDASLAGNCFLANRGTHLARLRPDWVTIIAGSMTANADPNDVDAQVIGYAYRPGGTGAVEFYDVAEVAHYAPIPDPLFRWRGMSWLTPVLREVEADQAATVHKAKFFENGATPNMVVKHEQSLTDEQVKALIHKLNERHQGAENAYKTLLLTGGLDVEVVGKDFQQLEFKATQGAGETRIAAAAGVPPVIVGLSEGLESATYSNYAQARRRFADGTIRPLWRIASAALGSILPTPEGDQVPPSPHLWYDDRDVAFLREDVADQADIQQTEATTIKQLIDAGFEPDDVISAVLARDLRRLVGKHSGLYSVQLQRPGSTRSNVDVA